MAFMAPTISLRVDSRRFVRLWIKIVAGYALMYTAYFALVALSAMFALQYRTQNRR